MRVGSLPQPSHSGTRERWASGDLEQPVGPGSRHSAILAETPARCAVYVKSKANLYQGFGQTTLLTAHCIQALVDIRECCRQLI